MKTKCFCVILLFFVNFALCEKIKIGGLFDTDSDEPELAFGHAIEFVNSENRISENYQLEGQSIKVPNGNELMTSQKLCRLLRSKVAAIFGPASPSTAAHVQSVCDAKEMPHIETRSSLEATVPTLNLHPYPPAFGMVFLDLVKLFEWTSFTILYETGPYIPIVSDLLKMYDRKGYTITLRQLDLNVNDNFRPILAHVKESGEQNIILHCSVALLPEVLKQAQQVGLMTGYHQFFITCLDMHTIDMEPFQYSGTNITGVRLIDPEDPMVIKAAEFFNISERAKGVDVAEGLTPEKLRVETALMYDGVLLLAEALKDLEGHTQLETVSLKCNDAATWKNGYSIVNYMKTSVIYGLTRVIKFDHYGHRSNFLLDIVELGQEGLKKIGTWNSTEGLKMAREQDIAQSVFDDGSLRNKTFVVITALSPPYGMLKENTERLSGNDRFEGFGIDLIHDLSLMLGFNYTFILQEDGAYGSLNRETGEWNGMIRELHEFRADLAITDLTITSEREGAVDFTMPFMNLGISILYRKPTKQPPSLFSFMSPFSTEVWLYLGVAYLGVSISLFVLGRLSPCEWDNPYPCIEEPEELENQFSLANSLWFTIGALLQQGSEIAPKGPSTRAMASIWWFFTLIMVSSYTANLAAFLTVESLYAPISNVEDLANANGVIKYGAKRGGSTYNFFKDAEYPVYQKMYQFMASNPDLLTSSNPEGLDRVKNENYAYFMESTSIEYTIERECMLTQIGGLLDEKGYGIAMRKNSPYRNALSEAVLRLQEQGVLTKMKNKWWKEKRGGGACASASDDGGALALGLPNVGGVFILLMVGGFAAIIVNILEMVSDVISRSRELKVPFKTELTEELKFVCQCTGNTKPVRNRKSSSSESQATTASKKSSLSNSLDSVKETKESKSTTKNDSKKGSKTPKKDDLDV